MYDEALMIELRALFREEGRELLDELHQALGALAKAPSIEGAQRAMRVCHTLKGSSATAGFADFARLVHAMEDAVLGGPPGAATIDLLIEAVGVLYGLLDEDEAVRAALPDVLAALGAPGAPSAAPVDDRDAHAMAAPVDDRGAQASAARVDDRGAHVGAEAVHDRDAHVGAEAVDDRDAHVGAAPVNDRDAHVSAAPVNDRDAPAEAVDPRGAGTSQAKGPGATLRIDLARFDRISLAVADLAMEAVRREQRQVELLELRDRLEALAAGGTPEMSAFAQDLEHWMVEEQLDRSRQAQLLGGLEGTLRAARMVPLALLGPRLRRALLDAAIALGKRAALDLDLGAVEIDRHVLEVVGEALLHLLRNAVAHGIERPAGRAAAGKPGEGRVVVRASSRGTSIQLTVADDGAGIDLAAVERLAIARGVLPGPAATPRSEAEVIACLFAPGFSTSATTQLVSGRGVGLDAARSAAEALGGELTARARGDHGGASFRLEVPAGALVSRGILVVAGAHRFAFGAEWVVRAQRIPRDALRQIDLRTVLMVEGAQPLPVVELAEAMGVPATGAARTALIVRRGADERAVLVDEVIGETAIALRPLPWNLRSVPAISGLVLLPDGALAPVIDVPALLRRRSTPAAGTVARAQRLLVVDDSATQRAFVSSLLAPAGFALLDADDGVTAWDLLARERVDLVLADVQMPGMDGATLCEKIRASEPLSTLPVILVSSLGRPEEIERGLAAGADAYLVKGTFDAATLIAAVRRHLG